MTRQPDSKSRAVPHFAFDCDCPAKKSDKSFHDVETQTRSSEEANCRVIDLLKGFKDAGQFVGRNPDPSVDHADFDATLPRAYDDANTPINVNLLVNNFPRSPLPQEHTDRPLLPIVSNRRKLRFVYFLLHYLKLAGTCHPSGRFVHNMQRRKI